MKLPPSPILKLVFASGIAHSIVAALDARALGSFVEARYDAFWAIASAYCWLLEHQTPTPRWTLSAKLITASSVLGFTLAVARMARMVP